MSTSRRSLPRRPRPARRRASTKPRLNRRNLWGAERLEDRNLMAGLTSEFWNARWPADVNNDGNISPQDILGIINAMSARGIGALTSSGGGEGEQPATGGSGMFIDPNNDRALNPQDLLFVLNAMAEGEGPPFMVDYKLVPVIPGTNTPLTNPIREGDYFELMVQVKDNGLTTYDNPNDALPSQTRPTEQSGFAGFTNFGVFTAYLDMTWDTSQIQVQTNEAQVIKFTGSPTINTTTFRLTFNGNQTAPITFRGNTATTARGIQDALSALPGGRSTISNYSNFEVEPETGGGFRIRFLHDQSNRDVAALGAALATAGGATGMTVTDNVISGLPSNATSFLEAFKPRPVRDASDPNIIINAGANPNLPWYTPSNLFTSGTALSNGVHQAGSAIDQSYYIGGSPFIWPGDQFVEVFRVRMNAVEKTTATPVSFTGDVGNLDASHGVSVVGFTNAPIIDELDINITNTSVTLIEEVSAGAATAVVNEDLAAGVNITPTIADNFPLVGEVFGITSFTAATNGVVTRTGNTFNYKPNLNFNGSDSFTYTVSDGIGGHTDTATINITVRATNDAPENRFNGSTTFPVPAQVVAEDATGASALTFSVGNSNAISITDVDSASANITTTLTVSTDGSGAQGTLQVFTSNPPTVSGQGTGILTLTGPRDDVNAALSGLRFTPRPDFAGSATISLSTSDLGNTADPLNASIGTDTNDVININVTATNDSPVNSVPGPQSVDESATLTFSASNLISVSDIDAGSGNITVTLSTTALTGGLINVNGGGAAIIGNPNSRLVTITGTVAQVNLALSNVTYVSASPQSDTLTVLTNDNGNTGGASTPDSDPIAITVNATTRPRAINDNTTALVGTILEGSTTAVTLDVLLNDLTNAGETKFFVGTPVLLAGQGTIAVQGTAPNQTLLYTPPGGKFHGSFTFNYTMGETDNVAPGGSQLVNSGPSTATVTVTITNVQDAPVGVADNYLGVNGATEDVVFNVVAASGLLANDTDADNLSPPLNTGLTVDVASVTQPAAGQGSVSVNADGSFTWTPTPGAHFNGQTSFTYRAKDPQGNLSAATTVTIDVKNVPDAPVANPDSYTGVNGATEDQLFTVTAANGVLNNDTDPDNKLGDPDAGNLHAVLVSQPAAGTGTIALADDGSFTWTPPAGLNFNGTVTFTYKVHDDTLPTNLESAATTVTIQVAADNDAPVAGNATYSVGEGQTLNATGGSGGTGLLRFPTSPIVTDIDSTRLSLSVALVAGPSEGTFNLNSNGSFSYTPISGNPAASVSFTYTASDGALTSNVGTITINIVAVNNAPTANPETLTATEDITLLPGATGNINLLANDTDPENDTLQIDNPGSIVLVGSGTLTVTADGQVTYIPPSEKFNNTSFATFQYQVTDGINKSNLTTVTIKLTEVNDDPVATADDYTAIRNLTNQQIDVLGNDTNGPDTTANGPAADLGAETKRVLSLSFGGTTVTADGSGNSADLTTALGGKVRLVGGQVSYDSPPNVQDVTDTFDYTLSDGRGRTATTTVSVDIINFVAKSISGTAFIDGNGDGVPGGPTDRPLAGLVIHLVGNDLLDPLNPIAVNRTTTTGADGTYIFTGVRPGSYNVFQDQPNFMTDGNDTVPVGSLATRTANDNFHVAWPADNVVGNVPGLNFTEVGLNAGDSDLIDSSGLLAEVLASSGSNGMVFNVDLSGTPDWMYCLPGWNNLRSATIQLQPGFASAILTVRDLSGATYTKTIFQDPHKNVGGTTPPSGSSARFRILGIGNAGEYLLRIDGTAAQFGFTLAAAAVPAGEGEGPTSDPAFAKSADEVFAGGQWA